jgi:hypothetical protein
MNPKIICQNKKIVPMTKEFEGEKREEKKESKSLILNNEEKQNELSERKDKTSKDKERYNKNEESFTESIDEERLSKKFLGHKRKPHLINDLCYNPEEVNKILINGKIEIVPFKDFLDNSKSNKEEFNPKKWMKLKGIVQRSINIEDLSLFCNDVIQKQKENQDNFPLIENIKKEKEIELFSKKKMENEKNPNFILNKKSEKIKKILSCETLMTEQKKWINSLLEEISNIDIKDLITIAEKGRYNKLELVLDLDNTCIFSFLEDSNNKEVKAFWERISEKKAKLISYKYNNELVYSFLLIRKGLKEFVNYVKPLCNFHLIYLCHNNLGKEFSELLEDYLNIKFKCMRFKGIFDDYYKYISDLYIKKETRIIINHKFSDWANKNRDYENIIISKYFYHIECKKASEVIESQRSVRNRTPEIIFQYNKIEENKLDWKKQIFKQVDNIYNDEIFIVEHLNSQKLQFIYMKNIIKEIFALKFIYNIDTSLAIKLIRISTLADMKFYLEYTYSHQEILANIITICGGIVINNFNNIQKNEKIYLVFICKAEYNINKKEIKSILEKNPKCEIISEKFIFDTYYFMSNLENKINEGDPEYTFKKADF